MPRSSALIAVLSTGLVGVLALATAGCSAASPGPSAAASRPSTAPSATTTIATTPSQTPTPLDHAYDAVLISRARAGDLAGVRAALAAGADTRATDSTGATALVAAAYGNHVEVAQALVEAGSDVNHQDRSRQSAYLIATSEVGDDPRLLDLTLANGADLRSLDSFDGTGLIRAADRGFAVIVQRLIVAGVAVDHVNRLGWTALLEAVILGDGDAAHVEVVRLLLAAGADRSIPDRDGVTALQHAQRRGYREMVELLAG